MLSVHGYPGAVLQKYGKLSGVIAFVDDITAAAIALVPLSILWNFKKLQESVIIAAAVLGLTIYPLMR